MNPETQTPQAQEPATQPIAQPVAPNTTFFKSGIYWRQSLWNPAKTVPSILTLENGVLSLKSDKETAFENVPLANVHAKLTQFSTLVIKTGGKKYDITGVGAATSRQFTPAQKDELQNKNAGANTVATLAGLGAASVGKIAGGVAGAGVGVAGGAVSVGAFLVGSNELKKWKKIFKELGVPK